VAGGDAVPPYCYPPVIVFFFKIPIQEIYIMANLNGFDANDHEPLGDFTPIPSGDYLALITDSDMKPTKNGAGQYLELKFQIVEGEYKGRNQWARLNLNNPSSQAVEIAKRELSSICRAVGVMRPKDSMDLHDLPLIISVKVTKRADTGEPSNEIAGYKSRAEARTEPAATSEDAPDWMGK